jgi:DNA-binding transcriptional LysR family regulator
VGACARRWRLRRAGRSKHELQVLTVLALSYEVMPRAMRLFRQKHPTVRVHHQALHSAQIVSALALQEADIGYVFSVPPHPSLTQETLGSRSVVCVAPRGLLPARVVRSGEVGLADLSGLPIVAIDPQDPLGVLMSHMLRDSNVALDAVVTVQTYHVALALAQHGVGVAMVESCTAASADRRRVDVLRLLPAIEVPVQALRPAQRPGSQTLKAFTRCMQQALDDIGTLGPKPP